MIFRFVSGPETDFLFAVFEFRWYGYIRSDFHHASPGMAILAALREKYDLHGTVERYVSAETPETENQFIRK